MMTNNLIDNHIGLIKKIASKFYNVDKEDLIQVGVIGLLKAYQNFKDEGTTNFSTYAYYYIYGEMYNLAKSMRDIKVSKDLLKVYKKLETTRYTLAQKLGRVPTNEEIALFLELDVNMVNDAIISAQSLIRIDDNQSDINLHEVIPDDRGVDIDLKLDLDDSFKVLNDSEKEIIKSRYYEDLTQAEVARKLNMTQVMVSRYEKKSLEKMRMVMQ